MGDAKSVVDLGCGTGHTAQALGATGVDITPNCLQVDIPFICQPIWDPLPETFDYAVCMDVLEHIPESLVEDTVACLKQSAPHRFLLVCTQPEGLNLGPALHMTVRPAEWWEKILGMDAHPVSGTDGVLFYT